MKKSSTEVNRIGFAALLCFAGAWHSLVAAASPTESEGRSPIDDVGTELGIEEVNSIFDSVDGVQVCVRTHKDWLAWYPERGSLRQARRCAGGGRGKGLNMGVEVPATEAPNSLPQAPLRSASFINMSLTGGGPCFTLFPIRFNISAHGQTQSFALFQRSSPKSFPPISCEETPLVWRGKQTIFTFSSLDAFAASPSESIFIVYRAGVGMPPKVLRVRAIPDIWTDHRGFYIVSADLLMRATKESRTIQQEYESVDQLLQPP